MILLITQSSLAVTNKLGRSRGLNYLFLISPSIVLRIVHLHNKVNTIHEITFTKDLSNNMYFFLILRTINLHYNVNQISEISNNENNSFNR